MRGRICRTEYEPPGAAERTIYRPYFTLAEHDRIAAVYAAFWREFRTREGRTPTQEDVRSAKLDGIGRATWKINLYHSYCAAAGMLAEEAE